MAENITIARPYAKAVFMIAKEQNSKGVLESWGDFLSVLSSIVIDQDAKSFLERPDVSYEKKIEFLESALETLLKRTIEANEKNFVNMMVSLRRLSLLPEIYSEYTVRALADQNTVKAEMISAFKVTDKQKQVFLDALKRHFNKEIELSVSVDASLIGGAVVKSGDLVIDGSIKGRIEKMALAIL